MFILVYINCNLHIFCFLKTQLKIRSPHKSPSKRLMVPHDIQRKSPRLRDKQRKYLDI